MSEASPTPEQAAKPESGDIESRVKNWSPRRSPSKRRKSPRNPALSKTSARIRWTPSNWSWRSKKNSIATFPTRKSRKSPA